MKYETETNWENRIYSDHACLLCTGGLRVSGYMVTVFMDEIGVFVVLDYRGILIKGKDIELKQCNKAAKASQRFIVDSHERTRVLLSRFF